MRRRLALRPNRGRELLVSDVVDLSALPGSRGSLRPDDPSAPATSSGEPRTLRSGAPACGVGCGDERCHHSEDALLCSTIDSASEIGAVRQHDLHAAVRTFDAVRLEEGSDLAEGPARRISNTRRAIGAVCGSTASGPPSVRTYPTGTRDHGMAPCATEQCAPRSNVSCIRSQLRASCRRATVQRCRE